VGFGDVINLPRLQFSKPDFPKFMSQRLTRILAHLRPFQFPIRTISTMTTLSDRSISTAGALIIGDEVLSSKTMDTNSAHFGSFLRVMADK
jgi:hypothetical protein